MNANLQNPRQLGDDNNVIADVAGGAVEIALELVSGLLEAVLGH